MSDTPRESASPPPQPWMWMPVWLTTAVHAGAWLGFFYWTWFAVPSMRDVFSGFAVELPEVTVLVLQFSDLLGLYWLSVPLLAVLIAGDAIVDWTLVRHESYRLRTFWFLVGCIVPATLLAFSVAALNVVMMQFLDALTGAT